MQKILTLINLIVFFSCTTLPDAVGSENTIIVIASPEDKVLIQPLIRELFSKTISTPQPENEFNLKFSYPWEIKNIQKSGNILLAALEFPEDSTGDFLMKRMLDTNQQDSPVFTLGELYAKNQIICGIKSLDAISFEKEITANKDWILNEYRGAFEKRMKKSIYKYGKNPELSNIIDQMFGYTLDLQPDYKVIKSDSLQPFIWLGRGYPYRWLIMTQGKIENYKKSQDAWRQLNSDFSYYMPGVKFGEYNRSTETLPYKSGNLHVMRGVYEHAESDSGGPFFVYVFDTESTNEVILISGFVNHPGHEKLLLLKQLEVIAKTLH